MAPMAPVIFLDPIAANCGCAPGRCDGHQPSPSHADRRQGYRQAADLIAEAGEPATLAQPIAELLRACADLCIPAAHPSRPDPREVIARLLGSADDLANAVLPDDEDQDEEDDDEAVGEG